MKNVPWGKCREVWPPINKDQEQKQEQEQEQDQEQVQEQEQCLTYVKDWREVWNPAVQLQRPDIVFQANEMRCWAVLYTAVSSNSVQETAGDWSSKPFIAVHLRTLQKTEVYSFSVHLSILQYIPVQCSNVQKITVKCIDIVYCSGLCCIV